MKKFDPYASTPFQMNREDWIKVARGLGIAAAGAFLTWSATLLVPAIESEADGGSTDWRRLGLLLAAAVVSALVNAGRKFMSDNQ